MAGDTVVAEAVLSARARGRRVSLGGGWMDDSPTTTPSSSRRASLTGPGTWISDLQLARSHHLLQEALKQEVQKAGQEKKARSAWRKAVRKVQKTKKKRSGNWEDSDIEQLGGDISEEGSAHNCLPISSGGDNTVQGVAQNTLINEPVQSGLTPEESKQYHPETAHQFHDASLSPRKMGWTDDKDSSRSDENPKKKKPGSPKKKKKKKRGDKENSKNSRAISIDAIDNTDASVLRRSSSEVDMGSSRSSENSSKGKTQKRRLSGLFKKRLSKISLGKKSDDDRNSTSTQSFKGSSRSLHSDLDTEENSGQRSATEVGQRLRNVSGGSDLVATTTDFDTSFAEDETWAQYGGHTVTVLPRPLASLSPLPTSMYGEEDQSSDQEDNPDGAEQTAHLWGIPVIQVGLHVPPARPTASLNRHSYPLVRTLFSSLSEGFNGRPALLRWFVFVI